MTAFAIDVYPEPGKIEAAVLAVLVHLALFAVLFFGVQWQNSEPETVSVDLYERAPAFEPAPVPVPVPAITPEVKPELPPEPVAQAAVEAKPEPLPPPKPVTKAEPKPDIALKEKLEKKKKEELKLRDEQKKQDEAKRKEVEREQALKEQRDKLRKEAQLLQTQQEAAQEQSRLNAQRAAARNNAVNEYMARISAKIKSNIAFSGDIAGNPEAVFDVVQLPSGDVISAKLRKSSGYAAYDAAVERAIQKSSPLPKPNDPKLFDRALVLRFRPNENN
jgi:colicin import membrane protein